MPSYVANLQHFVWSTAKRVERLDPQWQSRLYEVIGGIIRQRNSILLAAGGMPDHIHLLVSLHPQESISGMVNAIKSCSSRWIHENIPHEELFRWQEKYGAFSVSKSLEETVRYYIQHQVEHHQKQNFQQEFRILLEKHEIVIDERYLWD
jgi:REP element-mobilizing transposase RayT